MNLIQLIRLILKNLKLVLTVPIVLVVLVTYLTRDQPKKYTSKTIIYTGIGTGYNLQSVNNAKFDFMRNKTAFDNLINIIESRKTYEEVALRLLARHLASKKPYPSSISKKHYDELMKNFPDSLKETLVVPGDEEATFNNLYENSRSSEFNYIYKLLNNDDPYYSIKAISKTQIKRISNSDLIEINYESDDPGICQHTLILLNKVFVKNYKNIKIGETNNVVAYFERQLKKAKENLNKVEQQLLNFNEKNHIINYYEQTKHISKYREDIDLLYQQEMMKAAAAKASIVKIEDQLNRRNKALIKSSKLINKRKELSDITTRIAILEVKNDTIEENKKELINLYAKQNEIRNNLNDVINNMSVIENSTVGLSQKDLLSNWLEQIIKFEESNARLEIYKQKIKDLEDLYARYAPLGATMMRIERQISVSEKEYLSILKGLNDSKIMQKNIQMSTKLNIIDKPFYPVVPEPSKRRLIIIASGMVGFVLTVFLLIVVEYFDSSIKSHENLEKLTGLPNAGAFPNLYNNNKKVDFDYVVNRTGDEIAQHIRMKAFGFEATAIHKPFITVIFSTSHGDGKTTIAKFLHDNYQKNGFNVAFFNYKINNKINDESSHEGCHFYNFEDLLANDFNVDTFFTNMLEQDYKEIDFIFIEIPSILHYPTPVRMMRKVHFALFVARANRPWAKAETNVLNNFKKTVLESTETECIANGVKLDVLETIIGEIPKRRSFIRKFVKRIIKLQFHSGKKLR